MTYFLTCFEGIACGERVHVDVQCVPGLAVTFLHKKFCV